ncbi:hypothetical protein MLD38_015425 [Melastoma candidum]|uniref:Uncharacterized protein n=1 Tax=Melastoma candidum TaxID=119954 RepID=A0ACB9RH82_9MYRT|nr:hypothetical protein MLD38_015425 [Melastoma candidum]
MELKLLSVALVLTVSLASTQAAVPPQEYWKQVLPSTRMPKAIKDILYQTFTTDEDGTVDGAGTGVAPDVGNGPGTSVGVGKGGVSVFTGTRKGRPIYVGVRPGFNPFSYIYAATETQLHDDPNTALFFLEKDLKRGKTMELHFTKSSNEAAFLPREVANTKQFSSNKLPEIYSMYSVKPDSVEAETMKQTIKECEAPGIKGEEKYCATSLESMIDFTKSKLGKDIKAVSTEVRKQTPKQKYTITGEIRRVVVKKSVVCHKENYPYAVFYCHKTQETRFYVAPMEGSDGTGVKAVVACHTDTSKWNPKHLAFQVLKVQPGTVPICHFLPEDHIVWFSN